MTIILDPGPGLWEAVITMQNTNTANRISSLLNIQGPGTLGGLWTSSHSNRKAMSILHDRDDIGALQAAAKTLTAAGIKVQDRTGFPVPQIVAALV